MHRIGILLTLISLFSLAGIWISRRVHSNFKAKPALLAHSMDALSQDRDMLADRISRIQSRPNSSPSSRPRAAAAFKALAMASLTPLASMLVRAA